MTKISDVMVGFGIDILNTPSNVGKALLWGKAWQEYIKAEAADVVGLPGVANAFRKDGKAALALKKKVPVIPTENKAQEAGSKANDVGDVVELLMLVVGKKGVRVTHPISAAITVLDLVGEYAPDPPFESNQPEVPISTSPEAPISKSPPSFQKWDDYIKS
jgi:hypothetical protein